VKSEQYEKKVFDRDRSCVGEREVFRSVRNETVVGAEILPIFQSSKAI